MKKIALLMAILFCLFQIVGCSSESNDSDTPITENNNNATYATDQTTPSSSPTVDSKTITLISCFTPEIDGTVQISFSMNGQEYCGLTNPKGEIFYYSPDYFSIKSVGNNCGYITQSDKRGTINYETGEITWLSSDAFDEVIGCGDGFLLTYKNNSSVSTYEYIYSVIDAKTGKEVKKNTSSSRLLHPYTDNSTTQSDYAHIGGGWFLSVGTSYNITKGDDWLYDSNNNLAYIIDGKFLDSSFINGKIRFYCSDDWIWRWEPSGTQRGVSLPSSKDGYFALNQSDGSMEISSGVIKLEYEDLEYLTFTDPATQTTIEYTNLPSRIISYKSKEYENYFLVIIDGADGKPYFTVIDKKGTQLCEPIEYYERTFSKGVLSISEDRVIYKVEDNWGTYLGHKIFDVSGKELFTIQQEWKDLNQNVLIEFHNGIIVNKNKIIDKFGNELQLSIKQ